MTTLVALLSALALAAEPDAAPKALPAPPEPQAAPSSPAPAAPAGKPLRVVVGDFTLAGAAHPELARVLSDAAARGAQGTPGLTVLGQGEIAALLGLERTRQMLGCTEDQGCASELSSAVNADRLISGSLTLLERTALVTVRFIDVRKNQTLGRTTATLLDATQAELVDAARRLTHEAVTGLRLDTSATIRIQVSRAGAEVTLDGRSLGASPVPAAQRVLEGPHTVTVQKTGFVRWSTTLAARAGQELTVDAELVPLALLGESARSRLWTWGWVSAGVAVAAGSAGVVFGHMADQSHAKYQSATERSQAVDLHDQTKFRATMANASWGVAGVAALSAVGLLSTAAIQDARASADLTEPAGPPGKPPAPRPPSASIAPLPGGAAVALSLPF
jgi:hypothetical protein